MSGIGQVRKIIDFAVWLVDVLAAAAWPPSAISDLCLKAEGLEIGQRAIDIAIANLACDMRSKNGGNRDESRSAHVCGRRSSGRVDGLTGAGQAASTPVGTALEPFVTGYMRAQNAPGMIVGMADRSGWTETAAYGFADIDARRSIRADERFHIGSITKSFTALMILQLVDEGKVVLDADVTRYLPDLPLKTSFGPVTVHHLLSHTSGLPGDAPPAGWSDPTIEQAYAPGQRFYYCNLGYEWLGRIITAQGGEGWSRALQRRVLNPLGMTQTSPLIGAGMRRLEVPSYARREDDRPFPRRGALTRAAPLTFTSAAGCIASTAADMNKYIEMLVRRGEGPRGRLLSPESFDLMVKRYVAAEGLGPNGGYGYGWMTGEVDGRPVIRHTGGMLSFMSSIHIDLEAGCGAFASINAQQNYRPVPVTAQALRHCRANAKMKQTRLPEAVPFDPDEGFDAKEFVGDYVLGGRTARVSASGRTLSLEIDDQRLTLESLGDDKFASPDSRYRLFTFLFRRERPFADARPDARNRVLALAWGRDNFVRRGETSPPLPEPDAVKLTPVQLSHCEGLYAAEGGWLTCVRVVSREGRLWVDSFDGVTPLAALGNGRFRVADEVASPATAAFSPGSVSRRTLSFGGIAMVRVGEPFFELE